MDSRFDPGHPSNRARTRQLQGELRRLLMEWDPIGVKGIPEAIDEYDCLISPLMHRLANGAAVDDLHLWLTTELTDPFGLTPMTERDLALTRKLVDWWHQATTRGV